MTTPASIRPARELVVPENHLRAVLEARKVPASAVAVVGLRGWAHYVGGAEAESNLIGKYDDPISVVTPSAALTFPGNTDPTRTTEGRAILQLGVVWMTPGVHNRSREPEHRRLAFIQASGVTIRRYDAKGELGPLLVDQWIGCNLHDGSWTTTGSAACQTVVPERWEACVRAVIGPLGISWDEWEEVNAAVKKGMPAPAHWSKLRFPYALSA